MPVIVLVLGATAIPVKLRFPDLTNIFLGCDTRDLVVNLILYIPAGMVLSKPPFCALSALQHFSLLSRKLVCFSQCTSIHQGTASMANSLAALL